MEVINRSSAAWKYLPEEIRNLIRDGELVLDTAESYKGEISDYSYLVFPFSKAYEGFLKRLFLDIKIIREDEYFSDDIRIGRILNPSFTHEHSSVYKKLTTRDKGDESATRMLWEVWKRGRNRVFHFFPHNYRKLSYNEAIEIVDDIMVAMENAVIKCQLV